MPDSRHRSARAALGARVDRDAFVALPALVVLAGIAAGCGKPPEPPPVTLDSLAQEYVEFTLAIGEHDPNYVDAYYGPPALRDQVRAKKVDLRNLAWKASDLIKAIGKLPPAESGPPGSAAELFRLRHDYLLQQARSAATRISMLQGA